MCVQFLSCRAINYRTHDKHGSYIKHQHKTCDAANSREATHYLQCADYSKRSPHKNGQSACPVLCQLEIQCVHKVPSGFWKIVARKQIELATCSLRQITVKLWKFFLPHAVCGRLQWNSGRPVSRMRSRLFQQCPQSPFGVLKHCGAQTNWASHMRFEADYSETLEVFFGRQQMTWWPEDPYQECDLGYSMLHRTWQELEYRLNVLRATKGAHIEVYWGQ
jgi:hypothetical protein